MTQQECDNGLNSWTNGLVRGFVACLVLVGVALGIRGCTAAQPAIKDSLAASRSLLAPTTPFVPDQPPATVPQPSGMFRELALDCTVGGDGATVQAMGFGRFWVSSTLPLCREPDYCRATTGDMDGDGDVDLADYSGFQVLFTGPM